MKYEQIPLNIWKEEYEEPWIISECNKEASELIVKVENQILLQGPEKSGKKHLASLAAKKIGSKIFLLEIMKNETIIEIFDEAKREKEKLIWIGKTEGFSKDVESRMNSIPRIMIEELSEDLIFPLLNQRLTHIGFKLKAEIIKYCIERIPRKFESVERLIKYINTNNEARFKIIKEFINDLI